MRLTVLVDNNVAVGTPFRGEAGLSYLLEGDGKKILFDTGASDLFIHNADAMNICLDDLDVVVLSHGHGDHTGGLQYLEGKQDTKLVAHPLAVSEKLKDGKQFGLSRAVEQLLDTFTLELSIDPVWMSSRLVFLGEVPRVHDFENQEPLGERREGETFVPDTIVDDSAVALRTEKGLFIITGCSHAGICNIIEYAQKVCQEDRISGVIGGFHLLAADERTEKTAQFLRNAHIDRLYPCHCTSFVAKAAIHAITPIEEIAVGTSIELD